MRLPDVVGAAVVCAALCSGIADASCSDLSLVLAIDGSSSIDAAEFALQVAEYATAFDTPAVQRALLSAGIVDVAAVFWADADFPFQTIPWHRIRSSADAEDFGAAILATQRRVLGSTDIGAGLKTSLDLLDLPERCTSRAVVNVSGDGRATIGARRKTFISLEKQRERAQALGVTVNGLAIEDDDPLLDGYYRKSLIVGPGAFVISVKNFGSFGAAIIQKLSREIGPAETASLEPG